jgi:hypothetical protein
MAWPRFSSNYAADGAQQPPTLPHLGVVSLRKSKTDPALIPALVEEGLSDLEIANRMGWTVGTLRVRCSQLKISLRRKNFNQRQFVLPQPIFDQLHQRATMMGVATSTLAAELLQAIVRDGLYNAVLDKDDIGVVRLNLSMN